jgi:opacity protein-like surface antigen
MGQGAQGTVKGGALGGVFFGLETSERYEFEIGYAYGKDGGAASIDDPQTTVQAIGVQARRLFGARRVKPYLDLGLGWYQLRHVPGSGESTKAMGGPLGAGAAYTLSDRANLRAGVEYHMIAAEPTLGTGNMEDYFWLGAAVTFRISGGP